MATIMSHNLPLIPLPLKASAAALAKAGLMMPGPAGLLGGALGLPEPQRSPPAVGAGSKLDETDETDRMSCCSDDSELSVGQEVPDDLRAPTAATTTEEMSNDSSRYSKDAGSELDFVRLHQHPQNQPPGMLRPSPTRLHEEFLRNSQLYAEELMRQQMQIVAAARGLAMTSPGSKSPLEAMANSPVGLVTARNLHQELHRSRSPLQGFRPARDAYRPDSSSSPANEPPAGAATGSGSFRGLHSHLSAISAITQNLNSDLSKLTSPTAFAAGSARTSRESSQSPPTANGLHQLHQQQQHQQQQQYHQQHYLNQQYPPHHHHQHHHHQLALAALNNNIANALHDQSLKFSIDNILKADFGRRITDPLLLKRTPKSAPSGRKANDKTPSAIDLSGAVAGCQQQQQQQQQESSALVSTSGTSTSNNLSVTVSKGFCPQRSSSSSSSSRASSGSVSSVGSVGSEDVVSPMSPLSSTGSLKGEGGGGGGGNSGSSATASANSATNGSSGGAGASGTSSSSGASASGGGGGSSSSSGPMVWPAWVYCTRYSDRPSSERNTPLQLTVPTDSYGLHMV
ncbi:homeobox protein invected-like [Anopheles aquasalis]|uniref:homeobox protein invected-like n=1 Tax=Anopheles aquasalis TaxID=42839 RepID=UPI00215B57F0|nr:homeobox protein invected-like [Anopheles aquasalis]